MKIGIFNQKDGIFTAAYLFQAHNIMIYITQLVYIRDSKAAVFHQFEEYALPIIPKYNGVLLLRIRPDQPAFIEANMETPYEIHLVSFPSDSDFQRFMQDEQRKQFLHLKEDSIKSVVLIKGEQL